MIDPISRGSFEAIVGDLGFPATRLGAFEIGDGRAAWEAVFPRLTPAERRLLLGGLHTEVLCATQGGRARWDAWQGAVPLEPLMTSAERRAWITEGLVFLGDQSALPIIINALATTPEAVQEVALSECGWLAVGRESIAWTAPSRLEDKEGRTRPRLIVLGPHAGERSARHELAHVWFREPLAAPLPALTTQGAAGLRDMAIRDGWYAPVEAGFAREERLADALAFLWGDVHR